MHEFYTLSGPSQVLEFFAVVTTKKLMYSRILNYIQLPNIKTKCLYVSYMLFIFFLRLFSFQHFVNITKNVNFFRCKLYFVGLFVAIYIFVNHSTFVSNPLRYKKEQQVHTIVLSVHNHYINLRYYQRKEDIQSVRATRELITTTQVSKRK